MHLVIYGPEGSGKGTQAQLLSEKYNLPIYTSGDLVRDAARNDKGLIGDVCRKALKEGRYVPDSEMYVLWKNKLKTKEAQNGFILDGFPRNIRQAEFLLRKISKYGFNLDKVIYLKLSDEESLNRLAIRARKLFEGSPISHDTPERIRKRLSLFRNEEEKVIEFFKSLDLLLEINGEKPVEKVFEDIIAGLKSPD